MQLHVEFDLDQIVYALVPVGSMPTNILTGNVSRIYVEAKIAEAQVDSYYVRDANWVEHIIPGRRIFITQQEAQDVLDIIA